MKTIPFEVRRDDGRPLVRQVVDGMRKAVTCGYYAPGDPLPSYSDLAKSLGVSPIVTKTAFRRLADEGLVIARPRIGTFVRHCGAKLWRGQVLLVVPPGIGNYRENTVHAVLRDTLTAAGYLPLAATVPRTASGRFEDFALLETMLRQQVDLTVCLLDFPAVTSWLGKHGVKFALFGRLASEAPSCVGFVNNRDDLALDDFISRCRATGISSVMQITSMENGPNAVPALRAAGIRASNWRIPPPDGGRDATGLVQRTADEFAARLAKGRRWLPELLFFRDDHLAMGALVSLLAAGIRIPQDVRVATWANKGLGPPFPTPLDRMEMDNEAAGAVLAECVLSYLRTGAFPQNVVVGPKYISGETV